MRLQIDERSSYKYVKVQEKRLDILSVSRFKEKLFFLVQNQGNKNIVLDISNCSFCDASGLGAINTVYNICKKEKKMFFLTGVQHNIEKLIKICKLDSAWIIAEDIDDVETVPK